MIKKEAKMASTYYNPNKSRVFDIDGQPVPSYVHDFLHHESVMYHLSPFSIRNYCVTLRTFLEWIVTRDKEKEDTEEDEEIDVTQVPVSELGALTSRDISAFLDYCRNVRKNGASTCCSTLSVLKTFFTYCVRDAQLMQENPAESVSAPKKITKPAKTMTGREALSLIHACDCGDTPARDVCIATFMLNCGLRITELVAMNISDIEDNTVKIWGNGRRKDRWISLNPDCVKALEFWKTEREMYELNDNALFVSRRYGRRLTERAVEQMIKKALVRAGLAEKGFSVKDLRSAYGRMAYMSGKLDIPELQTILGYKSTAFAGKYSYPNGEKARKSMEKFRIKG